MRALVRPVALPTTATLALLVSGCALGAGEATDQGPGDALRPPETGDCRVLAPEDVAEVTNDSPTVACTEPHTAQTYAVGELPDELADADRGDAGVEAAARAACDEAFADHVGADESTAMRTLLSWAWFGPSEDAWDEGARWYRCDVVGGGEQTTEYVDLPPRTQRLLTKPTDRWMACATGPSVDGAVKVPCSREHDWRAVSTVQLGESEDDYPGDDKVQARTRDFCSDQVGAYLQYPVDYDFGYTWFGEAAWDGGNRRSVCWARTGS
jgi:hypothetical protein